MSKPWKDSFYKSYIHQNYDKALELLKKNIPVTLLKFCSGDFNEDGSNNYLITLKNDEIWMSNPLYVNDPFDCALNIGNESIEKQIIMFLEKSIPGFYDAMKGAMEGKNAELERNLKRIKSEFNEVKKMLFISCFSGNDNLNKTLMWAHYANCHKGFCIEYDSRKIMNNNGTVLMPIHYRKNIERPLWMHFFDSNMMNENEFQLITAYTKSLEWKYENEWRILETSNIKKGNPGYRKRFVPAKCVYIGCNASEHLKNELKKICCDKKIELKQMKMEPYSFELSYKSIECTH